MASGFVPNAVNPAKSDVNFILRISSKRIVFVQLGGSNTVESQNSPATDKEIFMAGSDPDPPRGSAYRLSLCLAFALIILSLWRVDTGLVEQQSVPSGDVQAKILASPHDDSRSDRQRATSLEDLAFGSWGTVQIESEDEEVRRKATVALMVYATGNGIRR